MKKFLAIISVCIFVFSALPVHAFEIAPIKMLITADADTTQTVVLKIKNTATTDTNYVLSVLGLRQDNGGLSVFERGISPAETWVYPEASQVTVKAGETKSVNFIIKIPADSLSGSHYVGLAAESAAVENGQSSLNAKLVSLLTLQVSGLVTESVAIHTWEKVGESATSWQFNLQLQNTGSVEVLTKGTVVLKNYRGDEIFSQSINTGNKLLAGSKRALQVQANVQNKLQLPGLYQVQVKLQYGKTGQEVSALVYVWYIPLWSKVAGVAVVGILILLVVLGLKKLRR